MENPFKAGDDVITKVKGSEVRATVVKTWKNEVQVKTSNKDLVWRTMFTVRLPGKEPLVRLQKALMVPNNLKAATSRPVAPPEPSPSRKSIKGAKPRRRKGKRR